MYAQGRARVSFRNPAAFAICDRCGFRYNHNALSFQYDWRGAQMQNLQVLVCKPCLDVPQSQMKAYTPSPDPIPIRNARPDLNSNAVQVSSTQPVSVTYILVSNG